MKTFIHRGFQRLAILGLSLFSTALISAGTSAAFSPSAQANTHHSGPFGLGIILGEPTGLSAKYRMSSTDAVDFGLAYSFNNYVQIFADYLYHFPGAFGARDQVTAAMTPYIGIGGIFFSGSTHADRSAGIGLRLPLGIEWRPGYPPLGVFLELVPGVGLIPATFGFLNGGIGVRFYF